MTRINAEIEKLIENYGDLLIRISFIRLENTSDAEDVTEETFIKYLL